MAQRKTNSTAKTADEAQQQAEDVAKQAAESAQAAEAETAKAAEEANGAEEQAPEGDAEKAVQESEAPEVAATGVLRVRTAAPTKSFWRCGYEFGPKVREIPRSELTEEQVTRLKDEPMLLVESDPA
ncbi:MAG: hypothetical protein R3175_07485 [Marinobacter sp.]|uniref:hypothetical protein n=1 Tax=Marinobacter sp. TaxID=50741 RepID=UPI00299E9E2D|nr:hypothetical protein [Marinobacter sp.]MDX1755882.1 hypothetical protein [Marinobacter sp.]